MKLVPILKASTQSLKKSCACFVFFSDVIPPRLNQLLGREKTFVLNQKVPAAWIRFLFHHFTWSLHTMKLDRFLSIKIITQIVIYMEIMLFQ